MGINLSAFKTTKRISKGTRSANKPIRYCQRIDLIRTQSLGSNRLICDTLYFFNGSRLDGAQHYIWL